MKNEDLLLLKFGKANLLRDVTGAVKNGKPILIEDVKEEIDPSIDAILLK